MEHKLLFEQVGRFALVYWLVEAIDAAYLYALAASGVPVLLAGVITASTIAVYLTVSWVFPVMSRSRRLLLFVVIVVLALCRGFLVAEYLDAVCLAGSELAL